jgi:hypothetical protein
MCEEYTVTFKTPKECFHNSKKDKHGWYVWTSEPMSLEEMSTEFDSLGTPPYTWECEETDYLDPVTKEPVPGLHMWWGDQRDESTGKLIPMNDPNLKTVYEADSGDNVKLHTTPNPLTPRRLQRYFTENVYMKPLDGGFPVGVASSISKHKNVAPSETQKMLIEHFLETKVIEHIYEGKYVLMGNEGSGKTTILKYLEKHLPEQNIHTTYLELDEHIYNIIRSLKETEHLGVYMYENAWKLLISLFIIGTARKNNELTQDEEESLKTSLYILVNSDKGGNFREMIAWVTNNPHVSIPGYIDRSSVDMKLLPHISNDFWFNVYDVQELAIELAKKHDLSVLVDRTDIQWTGDETSKYMVTGVLCAVRYMLAMIGDIGESKVPAIIVALREHIWDSIHFNDSNKMTQDIEFLR